MVKNEEAQYSIFNNIRFYVLVSTVLISIFVVGMLRLQIPGGQLFYIRIEQLFGLLCIFYWYLAVIISPIGYVIGKKRMVYLEFARRAIGVSAAYFAVLHMSFATWGQLGGIGQLKYLPDTFKWSLFGGFIAVLILLVMAGTSFDKVIKYMTFRKWKWLHRLVYIGVIIAVLHIWSIGTHLAYSWAQYSAFILLVVLSGLETYRFFKIFTTKRPVYKALRYFLPMFLSVWIFWIAVIYAIPSFVQNYHSRHHSSISGGSPGGHSHSGGVQK